MKKIIYAISFSMIILTATSCKKDKAPVNEEELITTVSLNFTEAGTTNVSTFVFRDLDGEGGNPPSSFQDIVLAPGKVYNMTISLLNESVSPAENITDEIVAEAADHQFYYQATGAPVLITGYNNDSNGLPLGTSVIWTTSTTGNGTVRITLKHKPGIKASGDPVTVGDTDIELDWVTRVQ
jgi:hypothetical protein